MQNEDNPFTTKVFCAECGSAFGRKNWTTSRGKRKVWQCNNRYKVKGQIGFQNNHIDEETLEKAFMKAVELLQENRNDVVDKWEKLPRGEWISVNILDTFWEEKLKASALRLQSFCGFSGIIISSIIMDGRIWEFMQTMIFMNIILEPCTILQNL
jgi:site-specific recombinase, resolvase family, putative